LFLNERKWRGWWGPCRLARGPGEPDVVFDWTHTTGLRF